jgi:hypothetical protein
MPSILKIHNNAYWIVAFIFFNNLCFADNQNQCNIQKIKHSNKDVSDVLCDSDLGVFFLKHDVKRRLIWLETAKTKKFPILKLDENADPSLVGEEESIAFVTPSIVNIQNRKFIGLTVAERSMRGNGSGQCGAGSEIYFVALEVSKLKIKEKTRFPIYSCIHNMYLANDGSGINRPISLSLDNKIIFNWLTYGGYENSVTGIFDFRTNRLVLTEDKK